MRRLAWEETADAIAGGRPEVLQVPIAPLA